MGWYTNLLYFQAPWDNNLNTINTLKHFESGLFLEEKTLKILVFLNKYWLLLQCIYYWQKQINFGINVFQLKMSIFIHSVVFLLCLTGN